MVPGTYVCITYVPSALVLIHCLPKCLDAFHQLFLGTWLGFSPDKLFELMPKVFNGVAVRALGNGLPPVDPIILKKALDTTRSVFRVVILHKVMTIWKLLRDKWKKMRVQNAGVYFGIHYSLKNTIFCGTFQANSSPDMHLYRMLRSRKQN